MKFYPALLLVALCLCCKSKRQESVAVGETLRISNVADTEAGAVKRAQNAKIVLPGLNFGTSVKEYQAAHMYMIQGLGTNSYFVKPIFNKDSELFKVELLGLTYNASFADTKLWDDHKNLVSFFEKTDGSPQVLAPHLNLAQVKPGQTKWTHAWSDSSKRIKVGISEGPNGNTYEVVGLVYDQSMQDRQNLTDSMMIYPERKDTTKRVHRSKRKHNRSKHRSNG